MRDMRRTGTKKLLIKREGFELELEQQGNEVSERITMEGDEGFAYRDSALQRAMALVPQRDEMPLGGGHLSVQNTTEAKNDTTSIYVTSPMVGTFYSSPSPDDANFIKVGDKIDKNTVVCIIESMKVINEIKAGVS